jgi:soluble P-type ATPase
MATAVPALSTYFLRERGIKRNKISEIWHAQPGRLRDAYARSLDRVMKHRTILMALALVLVATAITSLRFIGTEFMPKLVEGKLLLVGSRAYIRGAGVYVPEFYKPPGTASDVLIAEADEYIGRIQVDDVLRPSAKAAMESLNKLGIRTILLTGDAPAIAEAIGRELGVEEAKGGLLPEDKLREVRNLRSAGRVVAMVGDGVNDAPALVAANVGIAVGSATDVASESASVLLLGDDLTRLADLVKLARQCHRIIMTNFFGTLSVDAVGVALAAFGMLEPNIGRAHSCDVGNGVYSEFGQTRSGSGSRWSSVAEDLFPLPMTSLNRAGASTLAARLHRSWAYCSFHPHPLDRCPIPECGEAAACLHLCRRA